ncbi:MAG: hypothetical protein WCW02_00375 [Candidatus Buchananbacteria bacterium]
MPRLCPELTTKLESTKALKKEFDLELTGLPQTGKSDDLVSIREVKTKLVQNLKELREYFPFSNWEKFYKDSLGLDCDLSDVVIPEKKEGFDRLIIVAKNLTIQQVYDKCQELFPCIIKSEPSPLSDRDLINDRESKNQAYAIWLRDRVEADEELRGLSVQDLKIKKVAGITLLERLIYELKYYQETSLHLDDNLLATHLLEINNVTLCSGSHNSDGITPTVSWFGRSMRVSWWHLPEDAGLGERSRAVIA